MIEPRDLYPSIWYYLFLTQANSGVTSSRSLSSKTSRGLAGKGQESGGEATGKSRDCSKREPSHRWLFSAPATGIGPPPGPAPPISQERLKSEVCGQTNFPIPKTLCGPNTNTLCPLWSYHGTRSPKAATAKDNLTSPAS